MTTSLKLSRQELRTLLRFINDYERLNTLSFTAIQPASFKVYRTDWLATSLLMPKTGSRQVHFDEHGPLIIMMMNAVIQGEIVLAKKKRKLFHHLYRRMQETFEPRTLCIRIDYATLRASQDALRPLAETQDVYRIALEQLEAIHKTSPLD